MNRRNLFLSLTLSVAGGVSLSACSESPVGPSAAVTSLARNLSQSPTVNIDGTWNFDEQAVFLLYEFDGGQATKVFKCSSQGTYTFVQTGTTFTGSYVQIGLCTAADGTSFDLNFPNGEFINGTISARHLSFDTADGCHYEGAVSGKAMTSMQGGATCGGGKGDGNFGIYTANWSATR